MNLSEQYNLAIQYHQTGQLQEAEKLYRSILNLQPNNADVTHLLGLIAHQVGKNLIAIELISKAINMNPQKDSYYFNCGMAHKELSQYKDAEKNLRKSISLNPNFFEAYCNLGIVLQAQGKLDAAISSFQQSLQLNPNIDIVHNNLGRAFQEQGNYIDAISAYRKALAINPNLAEAFSSLGLIYYNQNKFEKAIDNYTRALAINPSLLSALFNLGTVLFKLGRYNEAIDTYKAVVKLEPNIAEGHYNLANTLKEQGLFELAIEAYQTAIKINPSYANAHYNLANTYKEQGDLGKAAKNYETTLKLTPQYINAYINLGIVLQEQGKFQPAKDLFQKVIELIPESYEAYQNLGNVYKEQNQYNKAIDSYTKALSINSNFTEAHNNLGTIYSSLGQLEKAAKYYQHALKIDPKMAKAHNNLGTVLLQQAKHEQALHCYKKAIEFKADFPEAHSNLVFANTALGQIKPADIFALHKDWDRTHGAKKLFEHKLSVPSNRPLRIGYVSPDLRNHAVQYFIEPILENHDTKKVEVFCYAEVPHPDMVTEQLKSKVAHWRSTVGLNDLSVAQMIYKDRIDILIDLAGHTARSRIKVFTYKPAPNQASYLGYLTGTGLSTMDYWITDMVTTPLDTVEQVSEKILPLSRCWICYKPPIEAPLNTERNNYHNGITFGSFNSLSKITDSVVSLWSKILKTTPNSRLVLKTKQFNCPDTRRRIVEQFLQNGVLIDQLKVLPATQSFQTHLESYCQIDICLDTFPFTGGTTTAEALWMSTPIITLCGERHVERMSASMLHTIGLNELICYTPEEYVEKAQALANNLSMLQKYHSKIREMVASSPLTDGKSMAKALEDTFFRINKKQQGYQE